MKTRAEQIEHKIQQIETIMKTLNLYSSERPTDAALASSLPFCYDTMGLLEWLQWVMFPKTRELIKRQRPLPTVCEIHPLAEEEFKLLTLDTHFLLKEIRALDQLFNVRH